MGKKDKAAKSRNFKADMRTIKKEDVRKLQETFSQFFGANPSEMKKHSSRIRNKVYFFGLVVTISFGVIIYLIKNVNFVGL
ncbi:hypothetical protein OA416_02860 [Paracoccaceae bacterium]|nr:hypothetical protein [Paracoccaceae bacterium]